MVIAETKRLILSKITTEDAPFILELMNSPGWLKYIGDRNIKTVLEATDYIKKNQLKCYKDYGFGYYKLLLKSKKLKPIGTAGLLKRNNLEHVDIGFSLLPNYHQNGYGFEAANTILNLAKTQFNIKTICAVTLPTNQASIKLLQKLGLIFKEEVQPFENDETLLLFKKVL